MKQLGDDESWDCLGWGRKVWGYIRRKVKVYKQLKGPIKTTEPDSSLVVPNERTKSSVHKLKYRKSLHLRNGHNDLLHVVICLFLKLYE